MYVHLRDTPKFLHMCHGQVGWYIWYHPSQDMGIPKHSGLMTIPQYYGKNHLSFDPDMVFDSMRSQILRSFVAINELMGGPTEYLHQLFGGLNHGDDPWIDASKTNPFLNFDTPYINGPKDL